MSPIECIKEGIRNSDWETVCKGYELLTGESLPIPETDVLTTTRAESALHNISNIIDIFHKGLPSIEQKNIPAKKTRGRPKKRNKKKSTISNGGEDSSIDIDDSKKTIVQSQIGGTQLITNEPDPEEVRINAIKAAKTNRAKTALKRKPTKSYKVKCNECEKEFESDRPQGEIGQKCSKCLSSNKSVFV
jgi:Zn finger protein HypA/HybF involved in hydrogenase expression